MLRSQRVLLLAAIPILPATGTTGSAPGQAPQISHPSGLYTEPFLTAITALESATIRYSLDGSLPTAESTVYTGPILVSTTVGLRARAFDENGEQGPIATASYFFETAMEHTFPTINIVVDPMDLFDPHTGIYANPEQRGRAWERPAHVSIFSPGGFPHASIDAGLRIHGGVSRSAPKKSFRLYFRDEYGQTSWTLPWMTRSPASGLSHLVLRAGGNDSFVGPDPEQVPETTFIRDQLIRDWYHEQGHYSPDGFFAALYINGEYWGLYNPTERVTEEQMDAVFGGGANYDIIKPSWTFDERFFVIVEANDGDLEAWNALYTWFHATNMTHDGDFEELERRIDVPNFLDHFALNIFCQNHDWPHQNWIASRHRSQPGARWLFHQWDGEWGLGLSPRGWEADTIRWAQGDNFHLNPAFNGTIAPLSLVFNGNEMDPNRAEVQYGILHNPAGAREFIIAMENLMNFQVPVEKALADFDAYAELIRTEVPREAERWAHASDYDPGELTENWEGAVERVRRFLRNRPAYIRERMQATFDLEGSRSIQFQPAGNGSGHVEIRGRAVELPWTGTFFAGSEVELLAIPDEGSRFVSWSGLLSSPVADALLRVDGGAEATVTVRFSDGSSTHGWMLH